MRVGNPIELRKGLVQKGEIRIKQFRHRAILAQDRTKEHASLSVHRSLEPLIELRELLRIKRESFESLDLQPLRCKAVDKSLGLGIGQHASHLFVKVVEQASGLSKIEQLVIRHRTPQEVRQTRSQLKCIQLPHSRGIGRLIQLDSEQKLGRAQSRLDHPLHRGFPRLSLIHQFGNALN